MYSVRLTEVTLMARTVALERLSKEGYGQVICYPRCETEELARRLEEMRELGVKALSFEGEKTVSNTRVLGKGCVGIVVLAHTETGRVALKIRRTDADRAGMKREAEMLRMANEVNVGPKLLGFGEDLLMMDFVDGILFPGWIEAVAGEENGKLRVGRVLREILEQCWRLDEAGLDHGELSQASKHIIVDREDDAVILDFETASNGRRASNVTSVCHYFFMRGKPADLISQTIGGIEREKLLLVLRRYRRNRTRDNFEAILRACLVSGVD